MTTPAGEVFDEVPVPQADLHGPTSYKIGKKVKVTFTTAFRRGKPEKEEEYWLALSDNESVFGVVFRNSDTKISHMSYGVGYFTAVECLDRIRDFGYFVFDAGTTCPYVACSYSEMERAFRELGML